MTNQSAALSLDSVSIALLSLLIAIDDKCVFISRRLCRNKLRTPNRLSLSAAGPVTPIWPIY
ncbi:hypothetical protein E2C01_070289 [Portunus trituberculatus]|uniref:Uncharacterized protein n=1 Tax=Portunus trituberculatus TaxID=210409 RepID=A0A5B7HSA8_PORTR|nr:hypothetical protein [Portunus trituberculatus]